MIQQATLFDGIDNVDFPAYHYQNPQIYELFKIYTNKALQRGFKNFSAEFVFNIIRWESNISTTDPMNFKLNNNYKAFYSRMYMNEHPQYVGFFRTRKSKFDNIKKP